MSYFPESARKTNLEKIGTPSPGQYNPSLTHSKSVACAPFGSTQKLNRSLFNAKENNPEKNTNNNNQIYTLNDIDIQLKQELQTTSAFKSNTHRFKNQIIQIPGPGQYDIASRSLNHSRSHHTFSQNKPNIFSKHTVPSIPIDNLGFKEDENNQMKKVSAPSVDPQTDVYKPQSTLGGKGVLAWKAERTIRREKQKNPGPGEYQYELKISKSVSSCFASSTDRFSKFKKIKEQKIPGPGSYNCNGLKKNSYNKSGEAFFNSKTSRFQQDPNDYSLGPGSYFNDKKKSHSVSHIKKIIPKQQYVINKSSAQKNTFFDLVNSNPGPGHYKTTQGMSYQIQRMLLKKQATNALPKEPRKVFENKEAEENPGPGSYQTPIKPKKSNGKLWKKTEVVNLKEEELPSPSPMDYVIIQHTIEEKVKHMNNKLTLTDEKPFNTGAERFKHYPKLKESKMEATESEGNEEDLDLQKNQSKKVKRLVMTTIKVRVPFGISSNKYEEKQPTYEGPDFYTLPKNWVKPSFNIKSKLN